MLQFSDIPFLRAIKIKPVYNPKKEVLLKMGHVEKNEVLAKFMKNGEWDFHDVEPVLQNPKVAKHDSRLADEGKNFDLGYFRPK